MDYKGYCFWAKDVIHGNQPHYIIIMSPKNSEGKYMIVAMSSIKYKPLGTKSSYLHDGKYCSPYDTACPLEIGCIKDDNGKVIPIKNSYIYYKDAFKLTENELLLKQTMYRYEYRCKISDDLLKKIQKGAKETLDLPKHFEEYFTLFDD